VAAFSIEISDIKNSRNQDCAAVSLATSAEHKTDKSKKKK